ncbi:response regulator [Streptomyces sp. NPDC007264]|uniref:response regulator n=1 Tax=Streptomyces sp. NPDC007264 TaxID=3364777 RepID=UPI0036DE0D78
MGDTTVLIADDHELIRAGLAALIRTDPGLRVVGEAGDGPEAVDRAAALRPDVVLLDMQLPGLDGADVCTRIRSAQPEETAPRILAITAGCPGDAHIRAALRAGASGFLSKEVRPRQLLAALHAVAAGNCLFAPAVTRRLLRAYTRGHPWADEPEPALNRLTPREREVLRLVATGARNDEIAGLLTVSEATVKTHLNRAMTKLGLYSRAQAVVLAYESGLVVPVRAQET